MKSILTIEQKKWLIENYPIKSAQYCSDMLNVKPQYLRSKAFKMKLKVSKQVKTQYSLNRELIKRDDRYKKSKDIQITTAEQAYAYGFIWGDGHLSESYSKRAKNLYYPQLTIKYNDFMEILPQLNQLGKWKFYDRIQSNGERAINALLCDGVVGLFMKDNDYINKSFVSPTKILSRIPENLHCDWLLGYIDADGCFYVNEKNTCYQFCLAGSYNQDWSEIEKIFNKLGIIYQIRRTVFRKNKYSQFKITNKFQIKKLGDYIYNNQGLGLKRKRAKYQLIAAVVNHKLCVEQKDH